MKKLGLWMLAAILLCGSVVTFVACRGNHLEDIIGNVDNGSGSDAVKKWIVESLTDGAVFKIEYTNGAQTVSIKYEYDADGNKFTKIEETGTEDIFPKVNYDKETGKMTAKIQYYNGSDYIDLFGVIFNAQTNEYSRVNINATNDFKSIVLCNGDDEIDLTAKLTDACPEKVTIEDEDGDNELFYVYYATGETWEDIDERYEVLGFTDDLFNGGSGTAPVTVYWPKDYYTYDMYYNGKDTPTLYGDKVGKNESIDNTIYVLVDPNPAP